MNRVVKQDSSEAALFTFVSVTNILIFNERIRAGTRKSQTKIIAASYYLRS
jgi:hypothetical protein